jgi:hypothetical protein
MCSRSACSGHEQQHERQAGRPAGGREPYQSPRIPSRQKADAPHLTAPRPPPPPSRHAPQVEKPSDIAAASKLIFPGVGSFGQAMRILKERDLVNPLVDYIQVRHVA